MDIDSVRILEKRIEAYRNRIILLNIHIWYRFVVSMCLGILAGIGLVRVDMSIGITGALGCIWLAWFYTHTLTKNLWEYHKYEIERIKYEFERNN